MKNTKTGLKILAITLLLWLGLVFLFGCKKTYFDEQMRPWKLITIKEGKQRTGVKLKPMTNSRGLAAVIKFDSSVIYYLGSENQYDINKVGGFVEKEYKNPDSYSAMIGWRWFTNWTEDKSDDRLQLLAFVNYEKGNFAYEVMVDYAEIGMAYLTKVYTQSSWNNGDTINNYYFSIRDERFNEVETTIPRYAHGKWEEIGNTKIEKVTTKFELKFSFGGQEVAPQDINLWHYYVRS